MRFLTRMAVVCFAFVSFSSLRGDGPAADGHPAKSITLLGTLEEWKYPGSKMPQGATMRGNGPYPPMQFVTCQTVLTTPDSIEKVIDFYSTKFKDVPDKSAESGKGTKLEDAQSVIVQEESKNRPVTERVILVNRAKSSTTLVISRAEAEKLTHITWLHFIRLDDAR